MNRRGFFSFLRMTPVGLPLAVAHSMKPDGVSLDGRSLVMDGVQVMKVKPDGSLAIGPDENITLLGRDALIEINSAKLS